MNTPENKVGSIMEPFAPTFTPTPPQVMNPSLPPTQHQRSVASSFSEKMPENNSKKKGANP